MKSALRIKIIKKGNGYDKIGKSYRVAYSTGKKLIDAGIAEDIDNIYVAAPKPPVKPIEEKKELLTDK